MSVKQKAKPVVIVHAEKEAEIDAAYIRKLKAELIKGTDAGTFTYEENISRIAAAAIGARLIVNNG